MARARSRFSSSGKPGPRKTRQASTLASTYSSGVVGGGAMKTFIASGLGGGRRGSPVVDMIEVSELTRAGQRIAISCAIMPPIDAPTTCALRDPEHVHQADRVARHVLEQIGRGDLAGLPATPCQVGRRRPVDLGRLADVAIVEADDPKAARGERRAEIVLPDDHLRAEAHDQQQRRIARAAEGLVANLEGRRPSRTPLPNQARPWTFPLSRFIVRVTIRRAEAQASRRDEETTIMGPSALAQWHRDRPIARRGGSRCAARRRRRVPLAGGP